MVLVLASPSLAGFSLGVKSWYNSFEWDFGGTTYDAGSALMIGPSATINYGRFFLTSTYMVNTSEYKDQDNDKYDREDIDINVGFMVTQNLGLVAGYKMLNIETAGVGNWVYDSEMSGWVLGVVGNIPLSKSISLYGNAGYLILDEDLTINGVSDEYEFTGWSGELGLAAKMLDGRLAGTLGYKMQVFEDKDFDDKKDFKGVTAALNYNF
jgi:hypothetical protein